MKTINNRNFPYVVLLFGVGFLAFLLSLTEPGVFFSGDGGLKYLIVRQLEQTGEFNHIISNHPAWVKEIWNQGYYPFHPPFVYEVNGEHMITFPVFFLYLSALFYGIFGFYGLYIIPAACVLLTWVVFLSVLNHLRLKTATKTIALFMLVFCTPLSFYGAVFWEHSLAVFLMLNAFIYFLLDKSKIFPALVSGILAGMSVWFREENFILLVLVLAAVAWRNMKFKTRADMFFIAGVLLPVSFYFIFNSMVFGSLFGLHGHQIVAETNLQTQLWQGVKQLVKLNLNQVIHFPIILVFYLIPVIMWFRKSWRNSRLFQLSLIILLYTCIVPFFLPSAGDKQWGPRFLLPLIPAAILIIAIFADKNNWLQRLRTSKTGLVIFSLVLIYSMYVNVYKVSRELNEDYAHRVYPALKQIDKQDCNNIIVDNQFAAQELTEKFHDKNFFLITSESQLADLVARLKAAGQDKYIFISMSKEQSSFPLKLIENRKTDWEHAGTCYMLGVFDIP